MKKGIKVVLIVFGVLVGLTILLAVIGSLLPEEESGNTTSEGNKPSASEPVVSEKSGNVISDSNKSSASEVAVSEKTVQAGKPAPAEDFTYKLALIGDGLEITGYKGSARNLTIPATIEDVPVEEVAIKDIKCEQIFVPEGVKKVSFYSAKNLRAISLPSTLEEIGLAECTILTSVSIPNGVTSIGNFSKSGIRSIVIPASVEWLIGSFKDCKDLITAEIYGDNLGTHWPSAFYNCEALETVIIHKGVTVIPDQAFKNCKSLKNLTLPSSLKTIVNEAFRSCSSLTSVVIPNGVKTIGESAFRDCTNLSSIMIPKSVTEINKDAFRGCKNLVTFDIEEDSNLTYNEENYKYLTALPKMSLKSKAAIKKAFYF